MKFGRTWGRLGLKSSNNKVVKLGDIAKIKYGKDHKKLMDGLIPVYGTGGLMRFVDKYIYDRKSVLIPRKGSLGNIYFMDKPFWTVDTLFYTEIDEDKVLPEFLYYNLKTNDLSSMNVGSAVPSLTVKVLNAIEIELPSLEEQKIIVNILKSIDDKIQLNKQINHHLVEQAKSIYNNILETENTNSMKLKEIAHIVMGQSPKSSTYNNQGLGLPLLNGAADFRGKIQPSKYTSDPKKIVLGGEYIFGVRATIGLTTKVFHKYAIGRGTGAAKAINREYDEFLYFVLENLFKQFAESGSGTVYINISKSDFDNYEVWVPSLDKIMSFHQITKPIMELVYINEVENERLEKIRNTILPKLMSGKITAF